VLGAGVDSVHVFPLGDDRMATVRAFADVMSHISSPPPFSSTPPSFAGGNR